MKESTEKIIKITLIMLLITVVLGHIAYRQKKKNNPHLTISEFLNGTKTLSWKHVGIGMMGGVAFGFVDNLSLFMGLDAIDPILEDAGIKNDLVKAGIGNTFSGIISDNMSTFIAILFAGWSGISLEETPVWSSGLGFLIGGLFGVIIPYYSMGMDKSK